MYVCVDESDNFDECQPVFHAGAAAGSPSRKLLDTCIQEYGQCGGNSCAGTNCPALSDSQWACCSSGLSCNRQDEWYWQCRNSDTPAPSPAQAPSTSGADPVSSPSPLNAGGVYIPLNAWFSQLLCTDFILEGGVNLSSMHCASDSMPDVLVASMHHDQQWCNCTNAHHGDCTMTMTHAWCVSCHCLSANWSAMMCL